MLDIWNDKQAIVFTQFYLLLLCYYYLLRSYVIFEKKFDMTCI